MKGYIPEQRNLLDCLGLGEHHPLLEKIGRFVIKEIAPKAAEIDRKRLFPGDIIKKIGEQGILGLAFSSEFGGLGLPFTVYIAALEMVAKCCAATGLSIGIHGTVCHGIEAFASEEQKRHYLPGLLTARKLACFALTEPDSGSDAGAMKTRAVLKDGKYVINGTKSFATNAGEADVIFLFARTKEGPSAFLIDAGAPGLEFGDVIEKLGVRGSFTRKIFLKDCTVPEEAIVGESGKGFEYGKIMLNGGRVSIAAQSIGIAQAAYDKALPYSQERKQFGKHLSEFQGIQFKLAEMKTRLSAARSLTYHASMLKDLGKDFANEAAQAKLFSSEAALWVCNEAIQIHGGYGYLDEYDVHRHWRDARLMTIGEGTSEILKLVISHFELKKGERDTAS